MTIITTTADLEEGMAALCALDPRWHPVVARTGIPPLRRREGGFPGLAAIIVSQQLSVASARAVWARVETVLSPLTPERILAADDEAIRHIVARASSVGKPVAIYAQSAERAKTFLDMGAKLVTVMSDTAFLRAAAQTALTQLGR